MQELKPRIHDEENGLDYVLVGDYYVPDIKLPEETRPIGKWGMMRRTYLKEARHILWTDHKHGIGTLYFGVKPNGDICGQDVSESSLRDVSRAVFKYATGVLAARCALRRSFHLRASAIRRRHNFQQGIVTRC